MRRAGLLLCVLLMAGLAQAETALTMALPFAAGYDLDAAKREALLASPELRVEVSYEPALKIWGWTGRLGYCTGRRICIKKKWRKEVLSAEAIAREPARIRVSIPQRRWWGLMPYRPAGPLRVSLPTLWPGELPRHIDSDLKALQAKPGEQQVLDAHLSPPYAAVAAFRLDVADTELQAKPYALPDCDPSVQAAADGSVAIRAHRQAEAYSEWLQGLAESDWWAGQLAAVQRERRAESLAVNGQNVTADVIRLRLSQGQEQLEHVQLSLPVLLGAQCPGSTQLRFSWRNGDLLAASVRQQPDIFADACAVSTQLEEALWWRGRLQRHVRSHDPLLPLQQWEAWRQGEGGCAMAEAEPATAALQQAAARWR